MTDQPKTTSSSSDRLLIGAVSGCLGILLLGAVFFAGFGLGFGVARVSAPSAPYWYRSADASRTLFSPDRDIDSAAADRLYPEFSLFWEAMDVLYEDFYGVLPESDEAAQQAIRGVLDLLDDPNTSFLTPEEAEYFRTNMNGEFEGIGARVGWDEDSDTLIIAEPFENQPAWNAGLRRNDLILAVDGADIVGLGLPDAVSLVRGPSGSTVVLTVQDAKTSQIYDVEVIRQHIAVPTVSSRTLGDYGDIAYVRLTSFNENAGTLLRQSVGNAMQRKPRALILDLRNNSGGLLRESVSVASIFLAGDSDTVVLHEQYKNGETDTYTVEEEAIAPDVPMVVLVNEASASASEIVAGALQDNDRTILLGTTTYGKGSVQLPHTLSNDGILRVTVARWLTPDKRSISGAGLEPDIVVELHETVSSSDDAQLQAAIDYINSAFTTATE